MELVSQRVSHYCCLLGRATIQTPTTTKPYSAPAGFRTTEPAAYNRYDPTADTGVSGYGFTPRYTATAASANYDDAENEAPMEDESYLLVPRYKGGQDESERIRQLLYSDQTLERVGSEVFTLIFTCRQSISPVKPPQHTMCTAPLLNACTVGVQNNCI